MFVYVVNKNGNPLMPCKSQKARKLLEAGKAKVIKRTPFTIKLLWDCEENIQDITAGMDTGSKFIGCSAVTGDKVIYQSEVELRKDVSRKMQRRSMYRRSRRARKVRYRKARWSNRASSRKEGRLPPSVRSKVESHLREKWFVESILPISKWKVETASFDIHKISNPEIKNYQNGPQKDFYNTKAYVLHRDEYKCMKCKAKNVKLHVHHIVFRSQGGTNTPDNLITLCEDCHEKLHNGEFTIKGKKIKTKHATEIGIIKSQLKKSFGEFEETFGYETKFKRENILSLSKTHYNDAVAICCSDGEIVNPCDIVYNKKHVQNGDYKQTRGTGIKKLLPAGKLFGFRKFDLVETPKGIGFIKCKRFVGHFDMVGMLGQNFTINIKKECKRLVAATTTLVSATTLQIEMI